jgi:hypothetical protein
MSTRAWAFTGLALAAIVALMVVGLVGPSRDSGPWLPGLTALGAVSLGALMAERSR